MGTPGVRFAVKKSVIVEALKKHKGVLSHAAKDLRCSHDTLLKRIKKDPELVELLESLRNDFENLLLDSGENTLLFALGKRDTDLTNALKSTFFILNNKGKSRGYSGQVGSSAPGNEQDIRDFIAAYPEIVAKISAASKLGRSSLADEQSLLHQGQRREEDPVSDELGAEGIVE